MITHTTSEHTLEIRGPRNIAWRPAASVHSELLGEAIALAFHGRASEAIQKAEDLWIAKHGDMHGIGFRVRTTQTILTATSPKNVVDREED